MVLTCQRCGVELRPENVDLQLAIAKCTACHGVFDLGGRTVQIASGAPTPVPKLERKLVPLPERFAVQERPEGVAIEWRWRGPRYFFQVVFLVPWFGFLAFWYLGAIASGSIAMMLFPLIHVSIGLFMLHNTIAGLLNSTRVVVERGELNISSGPVPPARAKRLTRAELDQLFCTEQAHRGKNSTYYSYTLWAVARGGKRVKLVEGLSDVQQALFLEDRIERALEIRDRPVQGEVRQKVA